MNRLLDVTLRARIVVILVCLGLTGWSVSLLGDLTVNTDFLSYLPKDDPDMEFFKETGRVFGGNYMAMVVLETEDVFTKPVLEQVRELTTACQELDGVAEVMSLTNILDIRKTEDGIEVGDLISKKQIPSERSELSRLRDYVLTKEMYTSALISKGGTTTAILIRLAVDAPKDQVALHIREVTQQVEGPGKVYLAGFPMLMDYTAMVIGQDMVVLIPIVLLVVILVLFASFRATRGVLLPLMTVCVATLWTIGAMVLTDTPITMISAILPVVLIANGTAYAIHILNATYAEYRRERTGTEAVRDAMRKVGAPVMLSALTTFIGFIGLLASTMSLIADFGLFSAIGIAIAVLLAVTLVPVALSFLKAKPRTSHSSDGEISRVDTFFAKVGELVVQHRAPIVVLAALSVAVGATGLPSVRTDVNFLHFFSESSEPNVAEAIVTRDFGGSTPVAVDVRGPIKEPAVLNMMLRFQKRLRAVEHVAEPQSVADLIAEMNDALNDSRSIPTTRRGVASLWLLIEGKDVLKQMVDSKTQEAMIMARLDDVDTGLIADTVSRVNRLLATEFSNQLVPIAWGDLGTAAQSELAVEIAGAVAADLQLDLAVDGQTLTDIDAVKKQLNLVLGQPTAPPSEIVKMQLFTDYLESEDAELELNTEPTVLTPVVVALAAVESMEAESYVDVLQRTIPTLVSDDYEGAELLAASLVRMVREAADSERLDRLHALVMGKISKAGSGQLSERTIQNMRADLLPLITRSWTVSPARFATLTGTQPDPERIVSVQVRQTGLPVVLDNMNRELFRSQTRSLGFAILLVLAMLMIQLRSFVGGLLAITPIVFTVVVNFGLMGWAGIPVNNATMMIASIAIGIGIDYTIHVTTRLKAEMRHDVTLAEALVATYLTTGKAVVINAVSVMAGFLVLLGSRMIPLQQFGGLTAFCMFLSAFGALTLFPALIAVVNPRFIRKGRIKAPLNLATATSDGT